MVYIPGNHPDREVGAGVVGAVSIEARCLNPEGIEGHWNEYYCIGSELVEMDPDTD